MKNLLIVPLALAGTAGLALAAGTLARPAASAPAETQGLVAFAEYGSLKGKVLTPDGEPAEGVIIAFFSMSVEGGSVGGGAGGGRGMNAGDDHAAPLAAQVRNRPEPKAEKKVKTDENGEFSIPRMEAKFWQYTAGQRRGGAGFHRGSFSIESGKTKEIEIKLLPSRGSKHEEDKEDDAGDGRRDRR